MTLDVPVPDPPSLDGPQPRGDYEAIDNPVEHPGDDYRREELEEILASGAWDDAFQEWASGTSLTAADFEVVQEYDLVQDFDLYWDPQTDQVGFRSPTLPDDARSDLDSGTVSEVESELDTLGRVVSEMLENDYLRRDDETFGFFADDEADTSYESRQDE